MDDNQDGNFGNFDNIILNKGDNVRTKGFREIAPTSSKKGSVPPEISLED